MDYDINILVWNTIPLSLILIINNTPAVGLCEVAKSKGSPAFIHTVGNSQLGQMMIKLAKYEIMNIRDYYKDDYQE